MKAVSHNLREGFTTGSAVTAASVAALTALYGGRTPSFVAIEAPAGTLTIPVSSLLLSCDYAMATVIKDGGDDPDCTHGARILAEAVLPGCSRLPGPEDHKLALSKKFDLYSGEGIGIVTMDGLPVKKGEPAINPVPRSMLRANIEEFLKKQRVSGRPAVRVSVPDGVTIAKHTLNGRLGIRGGISILGTTGVVKPVSMEAFTATIDISLNMAKVKKLDTVVLCFGRQSEDAARRIVRFPAEAYVTMGDFFRYAVNRAKALGFKVIVSGQPGKILKACLDSENTNVKFGVFSPDQTAQLLTRLGVGAKAVAMLSRAKTARHMWEIAERGGMNGLWGRVAAHLSGKYGVGVLLFSYEGGLLARK